MQRILTIVFLLIIGCTNLQAAKVSREQVRDTSIVMHLKIAYPVNESEIDENYMSNVRILAMVKEYLERSPQIDSITIFSYASPEGRLEVNKRLARERGRNAKEYLLKNLPPEKGISEDCIKIDPTPENWEGLRQMVREQYPYEDKDQILALLEDTQITDDQRKARLKKINGGKPWRYIRDEILPHLRYASWIAVWQKIELRNSLPSILDTISEQPAVALMKDQKLKSRDPWPLPVELQDTITEQKNKVLFALKTNMLYDVASLLNFSVEVPLFGERMSLLYYHQAPWWTWGMADNEYCLRFLSIGGEARWWFKTTDRLNGHFLGAYAESGKYDFEHQRKICYQGEFWSTGLTYGYAMPVGKKKKVNLEFSLSAGYASIPYRGYTPSEDYEILWRDPNKVGRLQYIGPTKAQISLVIPIKAKGGNDL